MVVGGSRRRAQARPGQPLDLGRLISSESEIQQLLGHAPLTIPGPGDARCSTFSYDAVLLRNADGVLPMGKANFQGLCLHVRNRANVIASAQARDGPRAGLGRHWPEDENLHGRPGGRTPFARAIRPGAVLPSRPSP